MQVTETTSEGLKRSYRVVVEAEVIAAKIDEQLTDISGRIQMKGFRPGKVPTSLVKKLHGDSIRGDVLQEALNASSQELFEERNLKPALQPNIEVIAFDDGKDLEFSLDVELMPEIPETKFAEISLFRYEVAPSDEQVDESVSKFAEQQKTFEDAADDHAAATGDAVLIDFVGRSDGEEFEGGTAEDHLLEIGSDSFIPGFEEQLVGVKKGDETIVKVTFPEEYSTSDLAGKDAEFSVTVKAVRVPKEVSIDDEFAKSLGLDDLEALRNSFREQIAAEHLSYSRARLKRDLLDQLADMHDFPVPEGLVTNEFDQIWQQFEQERERLKAAGQFEEEEDSEKSDDELREEYQDIATRRIRLGLLLAHVGDENNIQVDQQEMSRIISAEASRYPGQEKMVSDFYQENPQALVQLRAPAYEDKVVDFVLEIAKVEPKSVSLEELLRDPDEADEKDAKAAPKAKTKSKTKAKAKAKSGAKPKSKTKPKAKPKGRAKPKSQAKANAKDK